MILHEHSLHNCFLTFTFLQEIIADLNPTTFNPIRWLNVLMDNENKSLSINYYQLITTSQFNSRDFWLCFFFVQLPADRVDIKFAEDLLSLLANTDSKLYINLSFFKKFLSINKNFYIKALELILANRKNAASPLQIDLEFFDKYSHYYLSKVDLLKKVYFACDNNRNYFDHDCKHLLSVIKLDNSFFLEYISSITKDNFSYHSRELEHLSIIWQLNNAEDLV